MIKKKLEATWFDAPTRPIPLPDPTDYVPFHWLENGMAMSPEAYYALCSKLEILKTKDSMQKKPKAGQSWIEEHSTKHGKLREE